MEAFRLKGSKISGVADVREGKRQVQKRKQFPKLSSDPSSCNDVSGQDKLTFELGWRSSDKPVGPPIKSLLAQEMLKENESKRRSPSIIARLMGLDGLPPPSPSHKQHKSILNHQNRIPSEKAQRSSRFHGHYSLSNTSKDEQEFKDVFEVLDTPKVESNRYLCRGCGNADQTEAEITFIQQKFMQAKRLSTDEKLQHSKEFHDALEALHNNKDLLLKFLQQPDSLFVKHREDLQSLAPELHGGHVSSVKPFTGHQKHEKSFKGNKSKREILQKSKIRSPNNSHTRRVAHKTKPESPEVELEEKNELHPTRIVVLKPDLGKTRNVDAPLSSPTSSDDFRADSRLPCARNWELELCSKKKFHEDTGLTMAESREIAKGITRQMRISCCKRSSRNFQAGGFRGYAGDQSSSGSDTESEEELVKVPPIANFNRRNQYLSSSSRSSESSVSREAKKKLSERWRLTHKSEQLGEISRSSTLAEMLAISDREARPARSNGVMFEEGLFKRSESNNGHIKMVEPPGISSSDGWKDGHIRNLPKSRSPPASSCAFGSPRTNMLRESPRDYKIVKAKQLTKQERNNVRGSSSNHREALLSSNSRASSKKSQSSCNTSPEISFCPSQGTNFFVDDQSFEHLTTSEAHSSFSLDVNSDVENVTNTGDVTITVPSEPSHLDLSASTSVNDTIGGHDGLRSQDMSGGSSKEQSHSSVPEPQSPASAKEGDQPSPVSVLQNEFSSSSECFESLSADLHGLRMQLKLLKVESGSYEEENMLVSNGKDTDAEESVGLTDEKTDEKMMTQESQEDWKSLYLTDVMVNSRLTDTEPEIFMATWHFSESPVSPTVFVELEKIYYNLKSSNRRQRKFLFDHINSELLEIFKQFADPHPWVRSTRISTKRDINELQDTLHNLIMKKDDTASKCVGKKVLESESEWMNLEDDIDIVGKEIEKLLTDELISELVVAI